MNTLLSFLCHSMERQSGKAKKESIKTFIERFITRAVVTWKWLRVSVSVCVPVCVKQGAHNKNNKEFYTKGIAREQKCYQTYLHVLFFHRFLLFSLFSFFVLETEEIM